jgi:hypothetical protein
MQGGPIIGIADLAASVTAVPPHNLRVIGAFNQKWSEQCITEVWFLLHA